MMRLRICCNNTIFVCLTHGRVHAPPFTMAKYVHWPVQASVPLIGPWILQRPAPTPGHSYSLRALRACPKENPSKWQEFCTTVEQVLRELPAPTVLARLNARVLAECRKFFPPEDSRANRNTHNHAVDGAIAQMWHAYKCWRKGRGRRALRGGVFKAWRQYAEFRAASRKLRKQSVLARKERIYAIIDRAASAAAKDQMNELYNITRAIAARQRRERVRIRAVDGAMLAPYGQFQAIAGYFQQAFQAPAPFRFSTSAPAPGITADMLLPAVLGLKPRKAVPASSIPRKSGRLVHSLLRAVWLKPTPRGCAHVHPSYPKKLRTVV